MDSYADVPDTGLEDMYDYGVHKKIDTLVEGIVIKVVLIKTNR